MRTITAMQRTVLQFLYDFQQRRGSMPTRKEIADHFGWASPNAAWEHVRALVRQGLLVNQSGTARGTTFTAAGRAALGVTESDAAAHAGISVIALPVVNANRVHHTWRREQGRA